MQYGNVIINLAFVPISFRSVIFDTKYHDMTHLTPRSEAIVPLDMSDGERIFLFDCAHAD